LLGFLKVNRRCVQAALVWLKENNPLYQEIEISKEQLDEYPCDGVPDEITSLAQHLPNEGILEEEREVYVPESDDEGCDASVHFCDMDSGMNVITDAQIMPWEMQVL
jgi:hypothetical protein